MSHHCVANTKITTREDFSYVCEATVLIPAGEEIVTNYHHYHYQFYGTPYRRADLKNTWSFDCLCPRCKDRTEYGTYVSAMQCDNCKFGYILPIVPLNHKVSSVNRVYFFNHFVLILMTSLQKLMLYEL